MLGWSLGFGGVGFGVGAGLAEGVGFGVQEDLMRDDGFGVDVVFDFDFVDFGFGGQGLYDGYSGALVDDGLLTLELVVGQHVLNR
jgi:hypothetical protein